MEGAESSMLEATLLSPIQQLQLEEGWIFQQGNGPRQTAKVIREWFVQNNVELSQWPKQSPDKNPTEMVKHERSNSSELFLSK